MDKTMSDTVARKVLADVDPNVAWSNSLDFVRALAAFSTVYHHELGRRSHVASQTLRKLIWNACRVPSESHPMVRKQSPSAA